MVKIDINCDMGESFGIYKLGRDEEILDYVTSANIACGFHAGDPSTMRKTVKMALEKQIGIGAHPGFSDLAGFGRRYIDISPEEVYDLVIYQLGALQAFVKSEGGKLQHVKPHGALYNMAAKSFPISEAIAEAIYRVEPDLILFGLAGSELIKAGKKVGLRSASEVFADRTYQEDGSLTPRRDANALIKERSVAVNQVIQMINHGKVATSSGKEIPIKADTICIHGDSEKALDFARFISSCLNESEITVTKVSNFL
ncbi:MAG: 5-oxoprolinase subunit PxpA [Bacillota bacterium]|nr:5-oxoprolinase subunit PxpA [Bacillota bacterium]MDP4155608.1 5-oxoprolinase subunit PxpA [Bacillota bacterium]